MMLIAAPFQCTYNGPFRVLERSAKYFTLDLNGKRDTVSIDRLKPASLDADIGVFDSTRLQQPDPPRPTLPPSPQVKATHSSQIHHSVPAPSLTTYADACCPLRIVGRSRRGWPIRLPAKRDSFVASATRGGAL